MADSSPPLKAAASCLITAEPLYDSPGRLHALVEQDSPTASERRHTVLYLAGRPVAQLTQEGGTETWRCFTTGYRRVRMPELTQLVAWFLPAVLLLGLACGSRATSTDRSAIAAARESFAGVFEIEPRRDIYIDARYLEGGCPAEEEGTALYDEIFLDSAGEVRGDDSSFTYLNVWSPAGHFCYQVYYSKQARAMRFSSQAFY